MTDFKRGLQQAADLLDLYETVYIPAEKAEGRRQQLVEIYHALLGLLVDMGMEISHEEGYHVISFLGFRVMACDEYEDEFGIH